MELKEEERLSKLFRATLIMRLKNSECLHDDELNSQAVVMLVDCDSGLDHVLLPETRPQMKVGLDAMESDFVISRESKDDLFDGKDELDRVSIGVQGNTLSSQKHDLSMPYSLPNNEEDLSKEDTELT